MKGTSLRHRIVTSPNVDPRAAGKTVRILLLHYTDMESAEKACAWLCDPASKVSCHYLVDVDGRITQMVDEDMRAWHAGQSLWKGERDINSASIGIEIQNPGHDHGYPDFPQAQMAAVAALGCDIVARHAIPPEHVLAHSDVAPRRKRDPGEKFDWKELHEQGLGHWVPPHRLGGGQFLQQGDSGDAVEALQAMLALYGYGIEITGDYDRETQIVVTAFQRHFRPARIDGIADRSTIETLRRLIDALPAADVA
ncbi:peptidoglycan recognition protein family protein [Taklimakanibacter deserti]|uniref:peptidoglycan recognition protein family protein n=1 Tax=Taklimakanibacter deserti TaxID=2267839 RepID=UPI0034D66A91